MQTIIVYGKKEDTEISVALQKILDILGKNYIFNSETKIFSKHNHSNNNMDFLIIDTDILPNTQIGLRDIFIFKSETPVLNYSALPEMFCAVVESSNINAISILNNSKTEVVACGFSNKDTLTFSSVTEDSLVVSLQRSLKNVYDITVEPNEVPINLTSEIGHYALLSAIVTLILCGISFENQVIRV